MNINLRFEKYADGLIPAIVQDSETQKVLMLGFMNRKALKKTIKTGNVTFFSRSRKLLWTKGETSGNFLEVVNIRTDCDHDTILVKAKPSGPVCHLKKDTCFNEINRKTNYLYELERLVAKRKAKPVKSSFTARLLGRGIPQVAKKLGEEAVELVIEAVGEDDELLKGEASDLLYHIIVLLAAKDIPLDDVLRVLKKRRK